MLRRKNLVVVGLTTFNTEMLKISVSALARIKSKFTLIIHNDNPAVKLARRDIRRLGYRGRLHIINSPDNIGLRMARLRILDAVGRYAPSSEWIIYVNDDDILLSTDIPAVAPDNFAVIHSHLVVRRRVSDLITAATHPGKVTPDGENVILVRPSVTIPGTAIRIDMMRGVAAVMHAAAENLDAVDAKIGVRPPVDAMMWNALNRYAHMMSPNATPIFMDSINYICNGIDTNATKYGRVAMRQNGNIMARAMTGYDAAIAAAMAAY